MVEKSQVFIDIADLAKSRHLPQDQRIENYRSPDPIGVLSVTLLEAARLPAADFGFAVGGSGGSSDPYVVVKIGSKSWQSLKRMKTLNPKWGRWDNEHTNTRAQIDIDIWIYSYGYRYIDIDRYRWI